MSSTAHQIGQAAINEVIERLKRSAQTLDSNRLQFARDIHWARNVIIWKMTRYRSWHGFIRTELKMPVGSVYNYMLVGRMIEQFKYSDKEGLEMVRGVGWKRFSYALNLMKRRLKPKSFIMKYKSLSFSAPRSTQDPEGDVYFCFSLPKDQGCRLTAKLEAHGMRVVDGRRFNVREAMISFVNESM